MSSDLQFGLVIAATVGCGILPAVMLRRRSACALVLPELALFDTYAERKRAALLASSSFHGLAWFALLWLGIDTGLLAFFRGRPLLGWAPGTVPLLLHMAVFCFGPLAFASAIFLVLFRERMRRSLRQQLVEQGHAICIQCGYDLRGQPEHRCPECGSDAQVQVKGRSAG
jgi:hypothetical protein